jgi:DNA-binding transcriptional LysR family regulator
MRNRHGGEVRELRQFVEVASRRSISTAARHLNISQPALSRAIRKLEESYGVPLFVRTGAGVELSPYGSALYSRAVRILPALDAARDEIEHLQGRAKAAIRIATGDLWGLVILPAVVRRFAALHPEVVVHVEITDEGTRQEGLQNGVYDLVFGTLSARYGPIAELKFEPLMRQATYVYCDREHELAREPGVPLDVLLRQRWISPGYEDDVGPGPLGQFPRDFAIRADTTMTALLLLQRSPFLMSASSGFRDLFAGHDIVTLAIEDTGPARSSGVIYPARSTERPPVREFLRRTREHVRNLAVPDLGALEPQAEGYG